MVTTYSANGDLFVPEKPRAWSGRQLANIGAIASFDLAPDGRRIAAIMPVEKPEDQQPQSYMTFLLNFADELQRKAPVGK